MLNQRLMDMKKTLQHELKSTGSTEKIATPATSSNGTITSTTATNISTSATSTNTTNVNNSNRTKANGYHVTGEIDKNAKTQNNFVMDDVNFKYLKHVILKFLTSREVRRFN